LVTPTEFWYRAWSLNHRSSWSSETGQAPGPRAICAQATYKLPRISSSGRSFQSKSSRCSVWPSGNDRKPFPSATIPLTAQTNL